MPISYIIGAIIIFLIIVAAVYALTPKKSLPKTTSEENKTHHVYRDKPHSEQTTELPNRTKDNDITQS